MKDGSLTSFTECDLCVYVLYLCQCLDVLFFSHLLFFKIISPIFFRWHYLKITSRLEVISVSFLPTDVPEELKVVVNGLESTIIYSDSQNRLPKQKLE